MSILGQNLLGTTARDADRPALRTDDAVPTHGEPEVPESGGPR